MIVSSTAPNFTEVLKNGPYGERTVWSSRFKAWSRFSVKKPRVPVEPADKARWVEQAKFHPSSFKAVTGPHNNTTIRALQNFVSNFESLKSLQDLTIIHGPSGSGKSMLAFLYTLELAETMDLGSAMIAKWTMVLNASDYDDIHGNELIDRILKFIEPKPEKAFTVPFRVVVVDNFDKISHSNQTTLKKVMDNNLLKLKWIITCNNVKNLIGTIQTRGLVLQTKAASEKDSLLILLNLLSRNKVGFDRLAIKRLFDLHRPGLSLSQMLDILQRTFLLYQFVSEENVCRAFGVAPQKKTVSPLAALGEKINRCRICTLLLPCAHQPMEFLLKKSALIRERLCTEFRGLPGATVCPSFSRAGFCDSFLKLGRCSLAHHPNLHIISTARRVCPQCTVAWPCHHCSYSTERRSLSRLVELVRRRLELLTQINQPDPPAYLIRKIADEFQNWQELIAGLARFYLTKSKLAILDEVQDWLDFAFSAEVEKYNMQRSAVVQAFGEIVKSPLLAEPLSFEGRQSRRAQDSRIDLP